MSDTLQKSVDAAIVDRMSIRAFRPDPISKETITDILKVASRAPSGANIQPWQVYVLTGASKDELSAKIRVAHDASLHDPAVKEKYKEEYAYYPRKWFSPYIERRREVGFGLYKLLGIEKGDKDGMHAQHQKNYDFFGAPVGLMFTVHRDLERGSILDYGMFIQNIMTAAKGRGIDSCPQAAWNHYAKIVLPHIGASDDEMLVCGLSLGYADAFAIENTLETTRVSPELFTKWVD